MAFTSEPLDETLARRQRATAQYPEMQYSTPTEIAQVDGAYPDRLPTSFTQQAVALANFGSAPDDPNAPDAAPNVLPWTTSGPFSSGDQQRQQRQQATANGFSDVGNAIAGDLGSAFEKFGHIENLLPLPSNDQSNPLPGILPTQEGAGRWLSENLPSPVKRTLDVLPSFALGGEELGAARGIGGAIGSVAAPMLADQLLPANTPDWARSAVDLGAGIAGGGLGIAAAPRAKTWMEVANQTLADTEAASRVTAPEAFQIGRNGEDLINPTNSFQSFFPEAPGYSPAEDLAAARSVDSFLTSRGVDIKGMLEQDKRQLAGDLFQQERSGPQLAIAGEAPTVGGGADLTPENLQAIIDAKKAQGLTGDQIMADPEVQAYQRSLFKLDEPKDYNAPENLGGGVGTTPEQLANIQGSVQRAGQLNTIRGSLADARADTNAALDAWQRALPKNEPSAIDSVIGRNADELPAPTRTVPQNLAEIQARARRIANGEQPTIGGGANIPGGQEKPFMAPGSNQPPTSSVTSSAADRLATAQATRRAAEQATASITEKPSLLNQATDAANLPRSILTSFDLSAPFRQGAMLIGHPREFFGNLKPMLEAFASKDAAETIDGAIRSGARGMIKDQAGLYLSPLDNAASLTNREEAYMSRLAGKIPGVAGSQRAYATFLNKTRSDVFDHFWESLPFESQTMENAQRYAHFINAATGRGSLPNAVKDLAPALNAAFFSPRYFISRFESNGMGVKAIADVAKGVVTRQALEPVSKQIAGDVLKFYGAGLSALGLAKAAGANVELDPRSSDFGKIKVGDTRYDLWAGNQQIARFIAQATTGQRNSNGAISDNPRNRVALNFLRSKLGPVPGLAWDTLKGTTPTGDKVDVTPANLRTILFNEFVPMIAQDIISGAQDAGVVGAVRSLPTVLGVGTQTYAPAPAGGSGTRPTRPTRPVRPTRPSR